MIAARRVLAVLVASTATLVFLATSAGAATSYRLTTTFGEFTTPTDVTVDQANGNVYVTNSKANVIDILSSEGGSPAGGMVTPLTGTGLAPEPLFHFGGEPSEVAIDESGGPSSRALYVSDAKHNVVDKFALNGSHEYEYICRFTGYGKSCLKEPAEAPTWSEPDGVAVDSHGNVYIASFGPGKGAVYEFNALGEDVRELSGGDIGAGGGESGPVGVAVDSVGNLYVNNYQHNVSKVDTEGHESFLDTNTSRAVAVDAHDDVFVDDGSYVAEYNSAGIQINRLAEGEIGGNSEGVAVNNTTEDVYVSRRGGEPGVVEVFHPYIVPESITGGAEKLGKTTATVTGSVNPDGAGEATYFFQYGTTSGYGQETAEESAGSGTESKLVSANLTGLEPGTEYHYRLVAKNVNGPNFGDDRTFTTHSAVTSKPCPPINLRGTSGTLCVFINPEGAETSYAFMYGLGAPACSSSLECYFSYEHTTELVSAGNGEAEERFTVPIPELQPATTYHYRVLLGNELGFTLEPNATKPDETFTTPPAEPTVNDQSPFATGISLHEATLHGTVNPGNGVTTYHFEYGTTPAYGGSTPEAYTQLNYEDDSGEQLITGLQPGTVYHYRLIATNLSGTTTGPDETFTTLDGTPPAVETGGATQISPSSATIAGIVDPAGESASYEFEVGTSESYGTQLFGAISSREEVTASLSGLLPETVYHYRLVASSAAGTVRGADRTFTTPGYPITIVQPATPALLPIPVFPKEGPIPLTCKKGFVKKGNKCVKKKHHKPVRKKHKKK
jgi:hypothetical protein